MRMFAILLLIAIVAIAPVQAASSNRVPLAADFQADGAASARQGKPILILYSLPGCSACELIRRSYLLPMLNSQGEQAKVIVRQVDLTSPRALKEFTGRKTTHGEYSLSQGMQFAPVVNLVGPDGKALTAPLVGTMLPDFYAAYLDEAISAASAKLKAPS